MNCAVVRACSVVLRSFDVFAILAPSALAKISLVEPISTGLKLLRREFVLSKWCLEFLFYRFLRGLGMNEMIKVGSQQLQKAIDTILALGLRDGVTTVSPLVAIIEDIKHAGPDEALFLARLATESVNFNDFVVRNVQGLEIGNVFQELTDNFASIRADAKQAVESVSEGERSFLDKLTSFWKESTKGTIAERFAEIVVKYDGVNGKLFEQVKKETQVIDAYKLFRLAQGQGVVVSLQLKKNHEVLLQEAVIAKDKAQADVDAAAGGDEIERARLMTVRDAAVDAHKRQDKAWQTAKDIAEDISNAHHVSDLIMKEAESTIEFKDRIYKRGVSFIGNNRSTIAAFSVSYTAKVGLADGVNALEAMTKGMNDSLNDLADLSGKANERAIKAGYGATIDPAAVERFATALMTELEETAPLIEKHRGEAAANAQTISDLVEDVRKRVVSLGNRPAPAMA